MITNENIMKYIRTKDDKIYELQAAKSGEKYLVRRNELIPMWNTNEYEIIKQADTIEELCDCCVCFIKDGYYPYIYSIEDIKYLRKLEQFGGKIRNNRVYEKVYLTLWTDKGLIYVAKMNDKGELELL